MFLLVSSPKVKAVYLGMGTITFKRYANRISSDYIVAIALKKFPKLIALVTSS